MNKTKIILAALACIAMPVALNAQENLKKAMDDFITDKDICEYLTTDMFSENKKGTNESLTYWYSYEFDMPKSMQKKIDQLRNAFHKDTDVAYKVMVKSAGSNNSNTLNIAYGDDLEKNVQFGGHSSRNYMVMLVRDEQDSLKRYCYGVVWYTDKNEERLKGSLHKIYGKDPTKQQNNYKVYTMDSYGNLDNDDTKKIIIKSEKDSIASDIDFMQVFGNLCAAYRNNVRYARFKEYNTLLIGLANRMLRICRDHSSLLSKNEKDICIEELKEIQKDTGQDYVLLRGVLSEAMARLKMP